VAAASTAASDLYSLGALAYHLSPAGRVSGENAIAVGFAHLSEMPVPAAPDPRRCPGRARCRDHETLAKEPGDRPRSPADLGAAITSAQAVTRQTARSDRRGAIWARGHAMRDQRRRRAAWMACATSPTASKPTAMAARPGVCDQRAGEECEAGRRRRSRPTTVAAGAKRARRGRLASAQHDEREQQIA